LSGEANAMPGVSALACADSEDQVLL